MQKLRTRHKAVLVMRCYDGMSYGDIAESMGCNEFSIRMLFVRAKRALQKELLRNGFGRGSLLAALIVFGKMTAPSKAAAAQLDRSGGGPEGRFGGQCGGLGHEHDRNRFPCRRGRFDRRCGGDDFQHRA